MLHQEHLPKAASSNNRSNLKISQHGHVLSTRVNCLGCTALDIHVEFLGVLGGQVPSTCRAIMGNTLIIQQFLNNVALRILILGNLILLGRVDVIASQYVLLGSVIILERVGHLVHLQIGFALPPADVAYCFKYFCSLVTFEAVVVLVKDVNDKLFIARLSAPTHGPNISYINSPLNLVFLNIIQVEIREQQGALLLHPKPIVLDYHARVNYFFALDVLNLLQDHLIGGKPHLILKLLSKTGAAVAEHTAARTLTRQRVLRLLLVLLRAVDEAEATKIILLTVLSLIIFAFHGSCEVCVCPGRS